MEDIFNIICGICSIIGLLVSLFTASKVVKINSEVVNKNKKSTFQSNYVGRDSTHGTGNSKQE